MSTHGRDDARRAGQLPAMPERRRFLIGAGLVAGTLALSGSWVRTALAQSATAADASQNANFLALSRLLTGRPALDARMGERLYAALSGEDHSFAGQVAALADFAKKGGHANVEALTAALDAQQDELAKTLRRIVAAWYTGVVGEGPNARVVIAYADALMFQPVKDVLMPPTYCQAAPNYWVAKPPMA
ncbi:sorbitol dehydrogenase family protein [Crenobacter sp. SG2305]|uniref:sorbitol dehydrogenase family protein n=1 Tax=Crenobacter oryzisoli TaxID=3056844 RepID=UPI0025AA3628|nr:sorbitol dehydrogenase family protein [Crenobacter sp. SG2305]MDN0082754.1 sorbitol dehydrogenase family protein [Crenobacter sp. SG2305]